ncbi:MAG: hypothetical protein ACTSX2_12710 [Candidatus Thorarchaeota archaeon]
MEEIQKVLEALRVVERYEDYLFKRAWAKALIAIGIVIPLGALVSMNALLIATITGIDELVVALFAQLLIIIIGIGYVVLTFFGAWKTLKGHVDKATKRSHVGPLIGIIWFVSFLMVSFVPERVQGPALLWGASVACILSFLILRSNESHFFGHLLLTLGLALGIVSLPILFIGDLALAKYTALIAFSVGFIIAGFRMHQVATTALAPPDKTAS